MEKYSTIKPTKSKEKIFQIHFSKNWQMGGPIFFLKNPIHHLYFHRRPCRPWTELKIWTCDEFT